MKIMNRWGACILALVPAFALAAGVEKPPIALSGAGAKYPIFPYFYKKFDGHEEKLREIGYTPTPHLLTKLNCAQEPAFKTENTRKWIQAMKSAGRGFIFVKVDNADDPEKTIRLIRETADDAKEAGFQVTLYPYYGTAVPTAEIAVEWVKRIDRDNVGLTLHTLQEIRSDNVHRLTEIYEKVKEHVNLVVICGSDMPKEGDKPPSKWHTDRLVQPLNGSEFDWAAMVRAIRAAGYNGYYGQICWGIQTPALEYLTKDIELWKQIETE